MKLIEADKVEQAIKDYWKAYVDRMPTPYSTEEFEKFANRTAMCFEHRDELLKEIKALPSAQPEIIRCKDCKHSRFFDPCFYCYEMGGEIIVPENGFCFKAERREDEAD